MLQSGSLRPAIFRPSRFVCLQRRSEVRNKSITAAIERGRTFGDRELDHAEGGGRVRRGARPPPRGGPIRLNLEPSRYSYKQPSSTSPSYGSVRSSIPQRRESRIDSLPFTTAASEFIYGYSSVLAAIKADRRKFHRLYIHRRGVSHPGRDGLIARAKRLVAIEEVGDEYLQAFDKASSGRPHNGFILEASPLPVPPLSMLSSSNIKTGKFEVILDRQTQEDAMVNGRKTVYDYKSAHWRHPFVLYVDGVLDEGNLGAIARSAYFLGVDAIVTPTRQSAPWSHIAVKASAGAAEAIPIFKVNQATDFLGQSARAGWRIYASDAVPPMEQPALQGTFSKKNDIPLARIVYTQARSAKRLPTEHSPVHDHPTILMMGAEGTGLRSSLLNLAHFKVGILHGREVDEIGVDSLNVSVAASLLCFEMLQKPKPQAPSSLLF